MTLPPNVNPPPDYPKPVLQDGLSPEAHGSLHSEGQKFDTGKLRWSLLPQGTVEEVVKVLEHGAKKYAPDNWKIVPDARVRYYDAVNRHISAWWQGEKTDPETGLHHLAHAACGLLFLIWLDK